MRATAIIPVKRFAAAKRRLLQAVEPSRRAALVAAMLTDVLSAASGARMIERLIVVTGERRAERLALRHAQRTPTPLEVLRDPRDVGHPEAATLGIVRAKALGARCVALLPGDCPLLDPAELDGALEHMRDGAVTVVPDRHGTGTNALLLSPPDAIGPAFGPDSCARHADRAQRLGHRLAIERLDSLGLDVDTPDDLAALARVLEGDPGRAPATAAQLAEAARVGRRARA
jgi:2-phospho-L-lactate/phosphoenolpyruvate guanylyltransferase